MLSKLVLALASTSFILPDAVAAMETCKVVKTKGSICNLPGNDGSISSSAKPIKTILNNSRQACLIAFEANSKAMSVGYGSAEEEETICTFYSESLSQLGYTANSSSNTVYNDRACIRCSSNCHVTLQNGGFETGRFGAWKTFSYQGGVEAISTDAYQGNYAANLSTPMNTNNQTETQPTAYMQQTFQICPNSSYTLSFYYKADMASNDTHVSLVAYPNSGSSESDPTADDYYYYTNTFTTTYALAAYNFTSGPKRQTTLLFQFGTLGTVANNVLIDNVAVTPTT